MAAPCRNGSESESARRASRVSFHATGTRSACNRSSPAHTTRIGRPTRNASAPGVEEPETVSRKALASDDDEIGRACLAHEKLGGKMKPRPPFHPAPPSRRSSETEVPADEARLSVRRDFPGSGVGGWQRLAAPKVDTARTPQCRSASIRIGPRAPQRDELALPWRHRSRPGPSPSDRP